MQLGVFFCMCVCFACQNWEDSNTHNQTVLCNANMLQHTHQTWLPGRMAGGRSWLKTAKSMSSDISQTGNNFTDSNSFTAQDPSKPWCPVQIIINVMTLTQSNFSTLPRFISCPKTVNPLSPTEIPWRQTHENMLIIEQGKKTTQKLHAVTHIHKQETTVLFLSLDFPLAGWKKSSVLSPYASINMCVHRCMYVCMQVCTYTYVQLCTKAEVCNLVFYAQSPSVVISGRYKGKKHSLPFSCSVINIWMARAASTRTGRSLSESRQVLMAAMAFTRFASVRNFSSQK